MIQRKHITGTPLLLTILREIYNDPIRDKTLETAVSKNGYLEILKRFHTFVQRAIKEDVIKQYEYQLPREISQLLESKNIRNWNTTSPSALASFWKDTNQFFGLSSYKDVYPDRIKWKFKFK